jgi:hypothetical protein
MDVKEKAQELVHRYRMVFMNNGGDYVDELLLEHPTPDYYSVWKIIENGVIYGYEN